MFVVAFAVAASILGMPVNVTASSHTPPTVHRVDSSDRAASVRPTKQEAASYSRGFRKLPVNANLVSVSFLSDAATPSALEALVKVEARFRTTQGTTDWQELAIEP